MSRPLAAATKAALGGSRVNVAVIIRLDIVGDPVYTWTGLGNLAFAAGQTGDAALDGITFAGTGLLIEVGTASDGQGGSDALELSLPGVSLTQPMLRQVIFNLSKWQFRKAYVWLALLSDTNALIGTPFRIKTGRMDQMPYSEDDQGNGTVKCTIESAQAYAGEALNTRYAEQTDLNPTDTSQNYVWALANVTPAFGQAEALATVNQSTTLTSGGIGGKGFAAGLGRSLSA